MAITWAHMITYCKCLVQPGKHRWYEARDELVHSALIALYTCELMRELLLVLKSVSRGLRATGRRGWCAQPA